MSIRQRGSVTSNAWQASQSVALITLKRWTVPKSSTPSIKSKSSIKLPGATFSLSDSDSHGNVMVNIALLGIDPESVRVDQRDL